MSAAAHTNDHAKTILLAVVFCLLTLVLATYVPIDLPTHFTLALTAAAILVSAVAVFGPSFIALAIFIVYMATAHQYRSVVTVPAGGIVWHPRELLLALLFAHAGVQFLRTRAELRVEVTHYFLFCYAGFFAYALAWGVAQDHAIHRVVAEARYPIFLVAFFLLTACIHRWETVLTFARVILALAVLTAVAGIAFFAYTMLLDRVVNTQNALGEFMQYPSPMGPGIVQSVRPRGHMYYEIGATVLASLVLCREVPLTRKLVYTAFIVLFVLAIAIMMMRTARVSLAISFAILAWLYLPRTLRIQTAFTALAVLLGAVALYGLQLYEYGQQAAQDVDISLKGRFVEIAGGLGAFLDRPLLGAGMGSTFEAFGYVAETSQLAYAQAEYQTVHNAWLYFLFKGGLIGLTLVAIGLGGFLLRAHHIAETAATLRDRAFLRGLLAAFAGQLVASLAMPRLTYAKGHVFVALVAAAFVVYARTHPRKSRD